MRNDFESNFLAHHGILGMKWGIRRYQNYDGSYTRKGLERYNKDKAHYEEAKSSYDQLKKAVKTAKKTGAEIRIKTKEDGTEYRITDHKGALKTAKQVTKQAKREMNKSYSRLREHKLADQGKDLYAKGVRITGNATMLQVAGLTATGGAAATRYLYQTGNKKLAKVAALTTVGAMAAEAALTGKNMYQDRRLRAYYGHHQ